MSDPISTITALLAPVFAELSGGAPADPTVRPSDHADLQVNGALPLAKQLGTNPRDLAQQILDTGVLQAVASDVEVAGPGFINVTLAAEFVGGQLAAVAFDERLGVPEASPSRRYVVDYSSPNVAKEMHVGHLRTTVIGDALVRVLGFAGHEVVRENHIGDWGTPFGMLIEHLLDEGLTDADRAHEIADLNEFYKAANDQFEASPEFQERARQRVVLLQAGDPETIRLWELLVGVSTEHFDVVYDKLGVLLTDDDVVGESYYQPMMPDVVERLADAGLLVESDGADVVFPPGFENRDGDPLPLILQKRTGGFNYATSDLACVIDRVERIGADVILYVVDAGQALHFQMVFRVAEMAGWLAPPTEAHHVQFGVVLGADRRRLRSRSGEPVRFVDLLDEAVDRSAALIEARDPELVADDRAAVARMVGIGAVKWADLSTDRVKDYVFDWERMLSFDGNTAPYLQYAHARICSMLRRGGVDRTDVRAAPIVVGAPEERALALALLAYPTAIEATLATYSPHKLCSYLYDLATTFTDFYERCPVLKAHDTVREGRLALADLTARVLAHGLGLLGIDVPERM